MTGTGRSFRRVSKNALARLSAQAGARLLSLALASLVAHYESAASFGRYVLVITLVGFVGALTDLGLNVFLTREAAREGDGGRQSGLLGSVLILKLGLSAIGLVALVALAVIGALPVGVRGLLPLGALLLLPEAATGAMRAFVNGRQRMEVSGTVDLAVRGLTVVCSLPLLNGGLGVGGVLAASLGAGLVGVLLYGWVLWRWRSTPQWRWAPIAWRSHLAESYPFALTSIAGMVYGRIDLLLLGVWQGEVEAGWYGAAHRVWEAMGLLPASMMDAVFPEMSRLASSKDGPERLRRLFRNASVVLPVVGLFLTVAGILVAGMLIPLIYGVAGGYAPAVLPYRLLVCGIPAMFLYLLCGHTLYALDRQRRVTVVMFGAGMANFILNLYAIPRWSYVGAASVALLSEWLMVAVLYPQVLRALRSGHPFVQRTATGCQSLHARDAELDLPEAHRW